PRSSRARTAGDPVAFLTRHRRARPSYGHRVLAVLTQTVPGCLAGFSSDDRRGTSPGFKPVVASTCAPVPLQSAQPCCAGNSPQLCSPDSLGLPQLICCYS
ncbi:hypothetical protein Dimus_037035, partial [Dionaea muscipula]